MNQNQIAVITSLASPPVTPVQRQTRSGALYAPAEPSQAKQPRKGHPRSGCPNVDPPIPPGSPVDEASGRTKSRTPVSNPGYNVINQQHVNVNFHYHASPNALLALVLPSAPLPEEPDSSDPEPPSPSAVGDLSESGDSTPSEPPNDDHWDLIHALLPEELVAKEHGYAVKVVYPEDSWEDPNQGLFILARDAATLRGTYNRARKAAKSGTSLATIVREESHKSLGDAVETVVDAMAGLDVGGPKPQGSRKPHKSRKNST
ncbi:hypothetical protein GSI_01087 [Ganoderma sinense ZZ0214-1]|uniref:Uncharacterized protein n=1 Tax=Ganoderma sinense ZZ0214-1 TaxID=1077348 RepID=A0A2G8SUJ8_9APHY|nr:hypothetical protein GSI_01087 [Ganoderma sinense ZZ0214-1]